MFEARLRGTRAKSSEGYSEKNIRQIPNNLSVEARGYWPWEVRTRVDQKKCQQRCEKKKKKEESSEEEKKKQTVER